MLKIRLVFLAILCTSLGSCSNQIPADLEGVELYDWLSFEGLYDPSIDNKTILQLLEEGLFNDNQRIVNATLETIAWYAARVRIERWQPSEDDPLVERDVLSIAGLRKFLVDTWNREFKENPNFISEASDTDQLNSVESGNYRVLRHVNDAWTIIPGILSVLYPKDVEVHEIIWQAYNPKQDLQMLTRLEDGGFDSKRTTDYRIQMLLDEKSPHFVVAMAARGLGLYRSDDGLEALLIRVRDTDRRTTAIAHIVEAIVAHESKAIPYSDLLRRTAQDYDLIQNEQLERPAYFNATHLIGREFRIQTALLKLQELEEKHATLEP
ncbi:MAG: hypothetical protein F4W92_08660 [Gammaproteobacteria bacterium]|nr:hypothetical protein [Gammaproteobacteria bacterium]